MIEYERELEVKLELDSRLPEFDLINVFVDLDAVTRPDQTGFIAGDVKDAFWKLNNYDRGFTRIRTNHGHPQLSIKIEDKGNNLDRIEENQDLLVDFDTAVKIKSLELGFGPKFLSKRHFTFFLDPEGTSICCYTVTVNNKIIPKVFIEVESPDQVLIDYWERIITQVFHGKVSRSVGSLYTMFIEGV